MQKIALITGANRGIGFETARLLAQSGVTAIIGARDAAKGEQAALELCAGDLDVDWVALDVEARESVRAAAAQIAERHGRLDILINNAGILPEGFVETPGPLDVSMFRKTFETNLFGTMTVIDEFLTLLRAAAAARIVNVSSATGSLAWQADPSWSFYQVFVPAYQVSKTALDALTVSLAKHLKDTPIKVNAVCPGFVQTDITPTNRERATTQPDEASRVIVEMALIGDDGPSGTFVDRDGAVAW
jgi:NAD(P)-dependent dehydrogenase (short-subunit alcohol dehydrogenase family)